MRVNLLNVLISIFKLCYDIICIVRGVYKAVFSKPWRVKSVSTYVFTSIKYTKNWYIPPMSNDIKKIIKSNV